MAKKTKDSGFNLKGFIISGIMLLLVFGLSIFMIGYVYNQANENQNTISLEMNLINSSNSQLSSINNEIVQIVGGMGNVTGHVSAITGMFNSIKVKLDQYEAMPGHAEDALNRLRIAKAYVNAFSSKLKEYRDELNRVTATGTLAERKAFMENIPNIYDQEISPLMTASSQMMVATIQIATEAANDRTLSTVHKVYALMGVMVALLVVFELALFFFARYTKRSMEEIEHKNKQVQEASSKLSRSREKMEAAVQTNFLTGFKNRYSLEQDIGERLASEQFNIAAFDLDGFKSINDMYGYDFGDEYLVQIADRLKNEFGQSAEIYNITGNEFVFVFHREVSDSQTIRLVENIVSVMNAPYTIFNLTVQLTVSAAHYHYMAGDCLNVNSLLVKLDNVIRNAKRSGGGQILPVSDL